MRPSCRRQRQGADCPVIVPYSGPRMKIGELFHGDGPVSPIDNIIAVKHRAGFVAGQLHGNILRHASQTEGADTRSTEIMHQAVRGRLVEQHRAAGHRIVVSTAVFRFLAEAEAAEFGIADVIATEAERIDDRFTGAVAGVTNSREGKVERLHAWLSAHGERLDRFREVHVYADSMNDVPLLSHATHPVAVNADPALAATARHSGWPILTVE